MNLIMLMLEYVKWWYGPGWAHIVVLSKKRVATVSELFSIAILLRTLFAPWKRIVSYPGAGLDAHFRAFIDNLVSRVIGFFIRVSVLIAAVFVFISLSVVNVIQIISWPLVPIGAVIFLVWGLI